MRRVRASAYKYYRMLYCGCQEEVNKSPCAELKLSLFRALYPRGKIRFRYFAAIVLHLCAESGIIGYNYRREYDGAVNQTFVRDYKNTGSEKVRLAYGNLSSWVCMAVNLLLAAAKITAGALSGAISVLADGLNNLSDCGSGAVSYVGFRVAAKPADKSTPSGTSARNISPRLSSP